MTALYPPKDLPGLQNLPSPQDLPSPEDVPGSKDLPGLYGPRRLYRLYGVLHGTVGLCYYGAWTIEYDFNVGPDRLPRTTIYVADDKLFELQALLAHDDRLRVESEFAIPWQTPAHRANAKDLPLHPWHLLAYLDLDPQPLAPPRFRFKHGYNILHLVPQGYHQAPDLPRVQPLGILQPQAPSVTTRTLRHLYYNREHSNTRDKVVICVVCGGVCAPTVPSGFDQRKDASITSHQWMVPSLIKAKEGFDGWCKDPATGRAHLRGDSALLDIYPVKHYGGGTEAFVIPGRGWVSIDTGHKEPYLPIHRSCFEVAKAFCRYQSRFDMDFRNVHSVNGSSPSSIMHLYEMWLKRTLFMDPGYEGPVKTPIGMSRDYIGVKIIQDLKDYESSKVIESDPAGSPKSTTTLIIGKVVRIRPRDREPTRGCAGLQARMEALPEELRSYVEKALEPFDDIRRHQLVCTRAMPPSWWKRKLFDGALFPWLFDLDTTLLEQAQQQATEQNSRIAGLNWDTDMDWELLCRELGQSDVFGEFGVLEGVTYLQNRQRIWKILKASRLADVFMIHL
ncbi:hypothetical protein F4677DRAFT_443326 [Hypoxylon crocopeplum]|nr:hypothetical protein F4677DRAFT_443326 [Hypoxylon crocopeplum]